jgi:peptidoglycan/LPS O-acetylase OafA/YrhL
VGLPFAVMLAARVRSRVVLLALGCALLLVPTVLRAMLLGSKDWLHVLMTPQVRFEGLVVGAALAAASHGAGEWFAMLLRYRKSLFAISAAGIGALLAFATEGSWSFRVVGLLAFSLLVGGLIPFLATLRWPSFAPSVVVIGTILLSDLTYPLYLVHTLVPPMPSLKAFSPLGYGLLWLLVVFAGAAVVHLVIERPFLAWRKRLLARR